MPHIIIEYSKGLAKQLDIEALLDSLHAAAVKMPALPTGGIRTRARCSDFSKVADGGVDCHFIYITVRLGQGRSVEVKQDIGGGLFGILTAFTDAHFEAGKPLSLGLEIQEIEKDWTWKKNNIHQILKDKDNGQS